MSTRDFVEVRVRVPMPVAVQVCPCCGERIGTTTIIASGEHATAAAGDVGASNNEEGQTE